MPRRRRGSPYPTDAMSAGRNAGSVWTGIPAGISNGMGIGIAGGTAAWNEIDSGTYGMPGGVPFGAAHGYENAVEPTHNGHFAWNGEPIPQYTGLNQNGPTGGGTPYMQQAWNVGTRTFSGGGMPVPGSSGDPQADYGQRNTGINNADARTVGFQGGYTGYGPNGLPVQYGTFMRDGTQYGRGPHTIDPNKKIIAAVRYNGGGISAVKFQDGSVADIAQAIAMAEADKIEDVNTGKNREGQKTLRSYPDGDPSNNLSNLPRF